MLATAPFKRSAVTLTVLTGILSLSAAVSLFRYFYLLGLKPELITPRASGVSLIFPLIGWVSFNVYATWSAWAAESEEAAKKWFLLLGYGLIFEFTLAFFEI